MSTVFLFFCALKLILNSGDATGLDIGTSVRYRYFDDFLNHLDSKDKAFITGESDPDNQEGSGAVDSEFLEKEPGNNIGSLFSRALPIRTGSTRSKEMTCCMLGQLAGDKGYHCFVKFYEARILFRNYNRAHNKKIAMLNPANINNPQKFSMMKSADKLMRTFEQCVTNRGVIFHKCCHLTAMEKGPAKDTKRSKSKLQNRMVKG